MPSRPTRRRSLAAGTLAASLLLACAGTHADESRAVPSAAVAWKLVYERYDTGIGEGGAGVDIVTSERRRPLSLARRPRGAKEFYGHVALSPDGGHVAYVRSAAGRDELYVVRADGTGRRRLASGALLDFEWSSGGEAIAFAAHCAYAFEGGCRNGRIDVVRRDGSGRRVLARPAGLSRSAIIDLEDWSSRGDLLYLVRDRGRARLYSADRDGGVSRVLADSRTGGALGRASWSSDGGLVAYMRRCRERIDTHCDLAVMAADGGSKRLLHRWGPGATGPSYDAPNWLPGSRRLLLTVWGFGAHTRVVDVETGGSTTISEAPWLSPTVGADGRTVARLELRIGDDFVVLARIDGEFVARGWLSNDPSRSIFPDSYDLWLR